MSTAATHWDSHAVSQRAWWITLGFVAVALFYRRPEALLQSQFWQEDGVIFFQGNYETGLRAIVTPYAGYLHLLPRFVAAASGWLLPLAAQPTVYAWAAYAVALGVAVRLLSARVALPHKPLLAAALVLTPHRGAVFLMLTNVQWLLAVAVLSLVFTHDPKTWRQAAGDVLLLFIGGLTGPFIILVTPLLFLRAAWWRRSRFSLGLAVGAALLSLVQWYFVRTTMAPAAAMRIGPAEVAIALGQNTVADLFLGPQITRFIPAAVGFPLLAAGYFVPLALVWRSQPERRREVATCLAFGLAMAAAALYNQRAHPQDITMLGGSERYFYLPRLMVVWSLILCLGKPLVGKGRGGVALGLLVLALFSSAAHYQRRDVIDYRWAEQSRKLATGVDPLVLITHPGAEMRLRPKARPAGASPEPAADSHGDLFGIPPRSISADSPPGRFDVEATTLLRVGPTGEMRFAIPERAAFVQGRFAARVAELPAQPENNLAGAEFRILYLPADPAQPGAMLFNRVLRPIASSADRTVQAFRVTLPPDARGEVILLTFPIPGGGGKLEPMDVGWTGVRFY